MTTPPFSSDPYPAPGSESADAESPAGPLIDESLAIRVASLVHKPRTVPASEVAALRDQIDQDLPRIDEAARSWTGLGSGLPPTTARVVGRTGWVRANLESIRGIFEPLRERLAGRSGAVRAMSIQVGALFGLLSTKVLGQYILPLGGPAGGQLVVVGPNVLELGERYGDRADDIRRAVVLHEVTHRLQFDSAPWLEGHLRGLVDRYLDHSRPSVSLVRELTGQLPDAIARVRSSGSIEPLLEIVLSPEQAKIIGEAQGFMSLLEGHGNAAMYSAASDELIGNPDGVREAMASRHNDATSKLLGAVAGLEMKRRQYRDGEEFVRAVIARAGVAGLNLAFAGPDNLPGPTEVADPEGWLARVQAA